MSSERRIYDMHRPALWAKLVYSDCANGRDSLCTEDVTADTSVCRVKIRIADQAYNHHTDAVYRQRQPQFSR